MDLILGADQPEVIAMTALRKTWRLGQQWAWRLVGLDDWLTLPKGYQPAWFLDAEYKMVRDEHGNTQA